MNETNETIDADDVMKAVRDTAMLAAFVTSLAADGPEIHHEIWAEQTMIVSKGEGKFTLRFHMFQKGDPHVSFYRAGGGNSIGGVYF